MYLLTAISLFSLSAAIVPAVPNPHTTRSVPIQAENTSGTISVISNRGEPTELVIEFHPKQQAKNPNEDAPRTIRINIRTGLGTLTRNAYTNKGNTVPATTINICSGAIPRPQQNQLEQQTGGRVYSLESGLGQVPEVFTGHSYYDIHDLPIIRAYERHGNIMQGREFQAALTTLMRTLKE